MKFSKISCAILRHGPEPSGPPGYRSKSVHPQSQRASGLPAAKAGFPLLSLAESWGRFNYKIIFLKVESITVNVQITQVTALIFMNLVSEKKFVETQDTPKISTPIKAHIRIAVRDANGI